MKKADIIENEEMTTSQEIPENVDSAYNEWDVWELQQEENKRKNEIRFKK